MRLYWWDFKPHNMEWGHVYGQENSSKTSRIESELSAPSEMPGPRTYFISFISHNLEGFIISPLEKSDTQEGKLG